MKKKEFHWIFIQKEKTEIVKAEIYGGLTALFSDNEEFLTIECDIKNINQLYTRVKFGKYEKFNIIIKHSELLRSKRKN